MGKDMQLYMRPVKRVRSDSQVAALIDDFHSYWKDSQPLNGPWSQNCADAYAQVGVRLGMAKVVQQSLYSLSTRTLPYFRHWFIVDGVVLFHILSYNTKGMFGWFASAFWGSA